MGGDYLSKLLNSLVSVKLDNAANGNHWLVYSIVTMLHFLVSPYVDDINLIMNLLYVVDIFCDYDQSSEGEMYLMRGRNIYQDTYFANSGLPTIKLDEAARVMLGGAGITHSGKPILPVIRTGITEASILLFDAFEDRKSLRTLLYYATLWMIRYAPDFVSCPLDETLYDNILRQNETGELFVDLDELDNNPMTIGPKKVNKLTCMNLLEIIIMPILSISKYRLSAKPITDFPLFFFIKTHRDHLKEVSKEYLFTSITDIKNSLDLEPIMLASVALKEENSDVLAKYLKNFLFTPHTYHCPEFKEMHSMENVSKDTFCYLIFDLIERVVRLLEKREFDINNGLTMNIIDYLMEFPSILYEYASLYGWLQDPVAYSSIYTDIRKKYCQTVMATAQALLDLCFMSIFFQKSIDDGYDEELEVFGDDNEESVLTFCAQEFVNNIVKRNEKELWKFFSKFSALTEKSGNIESGFLEAFGLESVSMKTSVYHTLSLAILNGCHVGAADASIDFLSNQSVYGHSENMYLFLTGLEYVAFLLQAVSDCMISNDIKDPETYRDVYAFLNRGTVLKVITSAFGLQTETESFMILLQNMISETAAAKDRTKIDHLVLIISTFFTAVIEEIDSLHQRRTGYHIPMLGVLSNKPVKNLQLTATSVAKDISCVITKSTTSKPSLSFTSTAVEEAAPILNTSNEAKVIHLSTGKTSNDNISESVSLSDIPMVFDVLMQNMDYLRSILREFLQSDSKFVDIFWPQKNYQRQMTLFNSRYSMLQHALQSIYVHAIQTYPEMATVIKDYILPPNSQIELRSNVFQQSYIGGVYGSSVEQFLAQLIRNTLMVPELRSAMKQVIDNSFVGENTLLLATSSADQGLKGVSVPTLKELAQSHGICCSDRYCIAAFFFKEANNTLTLVSAHSAFCLTDSILIVLLNKMDKDFLSSNIQSLNIYACSPALAASGTVYGSFTFNTGSADMVCKGRSYHNLEDCRFCRTQGAIYHGRDKGQNYGPHNLQLLSPIVDFHNELSKCLFREGLSDKLHALPYSLLDAINGKEGGLSTIVGDSTTFFIYNNPHGKDATFYVNMNDSSKVKKLILNNTKISSSIHSIFVDKNYMRLHFLSSEVANIAKLISPYIIDTLFKSVNRDFDRSNTCLDLTSALADLLDGKNLPVTLRTAPSSLWILADNPNSFVIHFQSLVCEILTNFRGLNVDLANIMTVFDGIGPKDYFLVKALHAVVCMTDPKFGKILCSSLADKIVKKDIMECKQSTTGRLFNGTVKLKDLIRETTQAEYIDKRPSGLTLRLFEKVEKSLDYIVSDLQPLVAQIMAQIPVKFMTTGQFNFLGCPASLSDLVLVTKSFACNIDDTRRFFSRHMHVIEFILDEK